LKIKEFKKGNNLFVLLMLILRRRFSTFESKLVTTSNWVEMGPGLLLTKPFLICNDKWSFLKAFKTIEKNNKTYAEIKNNVPSVNSVIKRVNLLEDNSNSEYDFLHLEKHSIWNKESINILIGVLEDIRYRENTYSTTEHLEYFFSVAMPNVDAILRNGIRDILVKKILHTNKNIILDILNKEKDYHLRTLQSLEGQMVKNIEWFSHDKDLQIRLELHGFDHFIKLFPSSNFNMLYYNQTEANVIKLLNDIVTNLGLSGFVRNYNGSIDFLHDDIQTIYSEINKNLKCDELTFKLAFSNLTKLYNTTWKDFVKLKVLERGIGLPQLTFRDGLAYNNETICLHHFKKEKALEEKSFRDEVLLIAQKNNWNSLQTLLFNLPSEA
jgi:hypothetical protein